MNEMTVAEFLTLHMEASGKMQTEIAKEAGFNKPNVITMIKQGKTNLPLAKIGPMARAIGVDPMLLFSLAMREYLPDTWEAIESITKQTILTENETLIVKALRAAGIPAKKIPDSDLGSITRAIQSAIRGS